MRVRACETEHFKATLYVKNLTDKYAREGSNGGGGGPLPYYFVIETPRTIGLSFVEKFRGRQMWTQLFASVRGGGRQIVATCVASLSIASETTISDPPRAQTRPHEVRTPFGAVRNDEYFWLRDDTRQNPEMLAYLQAENAYADRAMAAIAPLETRLPIS